MALLHQDRESPHWYPDGTRRIPSQRICDGTCDTCPGDCFKEQATADEVQSDLHVYAECSGCGIHEWVGEVLSLTIEDADDEPCELTFHSRQCLLDWLTAEDEPADED